jgi:Protein of unknown function (DUF2721)
MEPPRSVVPSSPGISEQTRRHSRAAACEAYDTAKQRIQIRHHAVEIALRTLSPCRSAIVLAALGGATTCRAAFTSFVGATRDANTAFVLLLLFGSSLGCTVAVLGLFIVDGCSAGSPTAAHDVHWPR